MASDERTPVILPSSGGQTHDAPEGSRLAERLGLQRESPSMVMNRVYEGVRHVNWHRVWRIQLLFHLAGSRKVSWEYDEGLYKSRNEVERLFRRMEGFRRMLTLYNKLDEYYIGFIPFGTICDVYVV